MKNPFLILLILSITLLSFIKKDDSSSDKIKQIIIEKYKIMRISLKNGDPNYVLNMHTDDAILFQQNGNEVSGKVALKIFYIRIAAMGIDIESTPTSVELFSDSVAFEVGVFSSTTKAGIKSSAKYINVWKKVKGDWKIAKAIDQAKLQVH